MVTLGVETSGRIASVAARQDGKCLAERTLTPSGRRHAQTLVIEIDAMFREIQIDKKQCDLVAVSIGPGSFTGLRIGVVFAKTFAYAIGCRVAAVDTSLSVAEACPPDVSDVSVIGDAQREQITVARYLQADGIWKQVGKTSIEDAEPWCRSRTPTDIVTGPGLDRFRDQFVWPCRVLPDACWHPRASVIARIGERKLDQNQTEDIWTLEPFYVRKSGAEEKWDAAHGVSSPVTRTP